MKPIICALALGTTLAPALAQEAAPMPATETRKAYQPVTLDNGLSVTPLDVPINMVAKMMSIEAWRFKVSAPVKDQSLTATLQLRRSGGATPQFLVSSNLQMPKEMEYTVGFMPVEGDDFFKAENIRFYNETRVLENFPLQDLGSSGMPTVSPNPWLELNPQGYSFYSPVKVNKDGSLILMTLNRNPNQRQPPDAELVLVLTVENPEPKK